MCSARSELASCQQSERISSAKSEHQDDSMSLDWTLNMRRKCSRLFSNPSQLIDPPRPPASGRDLSNWNQDTRLRNTLPTATTTATKSRKEQEFSQLNEMQLDEQLKKRQIVRNNELQQSDNLSALSASSSLLSQLLNSSLNQLIELDNSSRSFGDDDDDDDDVATLVAGGPIRRRPGGQVDDRDLLVVSERANKWRPISHCGAPKTEPPSKWRQSPVSSCATDLELALGADGKLSWCFRRRARASGTHRRNRSPVVTLEQQPKVTKPTSRANEQQIKSQLSHPDTSGSAEEGEAFEEQREAMAKSRQECCASCYLTNVSERLIGAAPEDEQPRTSQVQHDSLLEVSQQQPNGQQAATPDFQCCPLCMQLELPRLAGMQPSVEHSTLPGEAASSQTRHWPISTGFSPPSTSPSSCSSSCAIRVTTTDASSEDSSDPANQKAAASVAMGSASSTVAHNKQQEEAPNETDNNQEDQEQLYLDWLLGGAYAGLKSQLEKSPDYLAPPPASSQLLLLPQLSARIDAPAFQLDPREDAASMNSVVEATASLARVVSCDSSETAHSARNTPTRDSRRRREEPIYDIPAHLSPDQPETDGVRCLSPDQKYPQRSRRRERILVSSLEPVNESWPEGDCKWTDKLPEMSSARIECREALDGTERKLNGWPSESNCCKCAACRAGQVRRTAKSRLSLLSQLALDGSELRVGSTRRRTRRGRGHRARRRRSCSCTPSSSLWSSSSCSIVRPCGANKRPPGEQDDSCCFDCDCCSTESRSCSAASSLSSSCSTADSPGSLTQEYLRRHRKRRPRTRAHGRPRRCGQCGHCKRAHSHGGHAGMAPWQWSRTARRFKTGKTSQDNSERLVWRLINEGHAKAGGRKSASRQHDLLRNDSYSFSSSSSSSSTLADQSDDLRDQRRNDAAANGEAPTKSAPASRYRRLCDEEEEEEEEEDANSDVASLGQRNANHSLNAPTNNDSRPANSKAVDDNYAHSQQPVRYSTGDGRRAASKQWRPQEAADGHEPAVGSPAAAASMELRHKLLRNNKQLRIISPLAGSGSKKVQSACNYAGLAHQRHHYHGHQHRIRCSREPADDWSTRRPAGRHCSQSHKRRHEARHRRHSGGDCCRHERHKRPGHGGHHSRCHHCYACTRPSRSLCRRCRAAFRLQAANRHLSPSRLNELAARLLLQRDSPQLNQPLPRQAPDVDVRQSPSRLHRILMSAEPAASLLRQPPGQRPRTVRPHNGISSRQLGSTCSQRCNRRHRHRYHHRRRPTMSRWRAMQRLLLARSSEEAEGDNEQLMKKFLVRRTKSPPNSPGGQQFALQLAGQCQCSHCCLVESFIQRDLEAKRRRKLEVETSKPRQLA